jgi:hypothetical protein
MTASAERGDLPYRTSGLYVGAGLGFSQIEMNAGPLTVEGGDVATKIVLGYRLPYSPRGINIALQGEYLDLGTASDDVLGTTLELSADGFDLAAQAYFPITRRWDILVKTGAYFWDAELKDPATNGTGISDTDSGTDFLYGFGASFNTGSALGFHLEVEHASLLDGAWIASASGTYQFK